MSNALSPRPPVAPEDPSGDITLIDPTSGEVVPLSAPAEQLAAWMEAVRTWEALARYAKRIVSTELHRRMRFAGKKTLHVKGFKIVGKGGTPSVEYDGEALFAVLRDFVARGLISEEAQLAAVKTEIAHTPVKRGINSLLAFGGEVAEAVRACGHTVEDQPAVTITAKGQGAGA